MLDLIIGTAVAVLSGMGVGSGGLLVVYLTLAGGIAQPAAQALNLFFFIFVISLDEKLNSRRIICLIGISVSSFFTVYLKTAIDSPKETLFLLYSRRNTNRVL